MRPRVRRVSPQGVTRRSGFPTARSSDYGADAPNPTYALNLGAAGHSRTFGGPSFLLLHAGKRAWRVEARRFER